MGYRIEYGQGIIKKRTVISHSAKKQIKKFVPILLSTVLIVTMLWGKGESVRSFLIPGNDAVTVAALREMVCGLRNGESLTDAVTAFCREIIENADIPEY